MNNSRTKLLLQDNYNIEQWLKTEFDAAQNGERRIVSRGLNDAFIRVNNFPLPDGYSPDYIDLLIVTKDYPTTPPIGFYVLINNNEALIEQIKTKFAHTYERAYYDAETIDGFAWVCYHYKNHVWKYDIKKPNRGDNIHKFLDNFYADLEKAL